MSSIGKIALSAASGTQENIMTLANLTFDFSLVKNEAPPEYQPLGATLSKLRKTNAEDGGMHATARQLGALFGDAIPAIPNLTQAYGFRVSEIAGIRKLNPQGSAQDGPFMDFMGADATTVWAAATSGRGALACHLLACLLARAWDAPKAISVWSEIVAARRSLLQRQLQEDEFHISAITTSHIDISRARLAEWDASARSWIRTADMAMRVHQTQLMLIIDNMYSEATSKPSAYDEVMHTWKTSLELMENLVSGVAQKAGNNGSLIGLCAWHIYPDICTVGRKDTTIRQNDKLVKDGSLLTIGLHEDDQANDPGLSWSIPLAHLRYYGKPLVSRTTLGTETARVPFRDILHVAIGSLSSTWKMDPFQPSEVMKFLSDLARSDQGWDWQSVFAREAKTYLNAVEKERAERDRLIKLGRRRHGRLLAEAHEHPVGFFGLRDLRLCFEHVENENCVTLFRNLANGLSSDVPAIVKFYNKYELDNFENVFTTEYITFYAEAPDRQGGKIYRRWIDLFPLNPRDARGILESSEMATIASKERLGFFTSPVPKTHLEWPEALGPDSHRAFFKDYIRKHQKTWEQADYGFPTKKIYVPVLGCENWSILVPSDMENVGAQLVDNLSKRVLSTAGISEILKPYLGKLMDPHSSHFKYFKSLDALATTAMIYHRMPEAEVNLSIIKEPLHSYHWATNQTSDSIPDRENALACIASFETGSLNLKKPDLKDVLAISVGNSIYATESLFHDPSKIVLPYLIRHVTASLGKPGLALMVSAQDLEKPEVDLNKWHCVDHHPFDGKLENNFTATTLHLWLTGSEQPLNTLKYGARDQECFFVETVISVYDEGKKVADLDLLHLINSIRGSYSIKNSLLHVPPASCQHKGAAKDDSTGVKDMVSIDHWPEVLDLPEELAIIRAHKNWVARLAIASLLFSLQTPVYISHNKVCWACLRLALAERGTALQKPVVLC